MFLQTHRPTENNKRTASGASLPETVPYFFTENLTAGYHGIPVVGHIRLSLEKGQILTLIGPNGTGKSTILKTLTGRLPSVSGEIYLDGRLLSSFSRQERARTIASVMTDPVKTEMMTAREVVEAGRYPYTGSLGILSAHDHEAVSRALRTARVEDLAEQNFMSLSDGQRQRILLARAFAQEPQLLILDEPTSYLDIRYQLELLDILRTLCKRQGTAVIMSLHELFLAERASDLIACVRNGRIERTGTVKEIFTGRYLDELYDLPPGTIHTLFGGNRSAGFPSL